MGDQTLGETFVGMTIGTPNEGDPTDLQHPPVNPWTANHSAVGRTVVFIRLNYDSTIFANGIPQISFLIHGKNNIVDPRTSPPTVGYSENSALCFADYMTNQVWGFRCAFGDEIDTDELAADANICDEIVALSTAVPMAITGAVLSVVTDFTQASGLAGDAWVKGPVGFTPWIAATSGYSKRTDTYTLTSGDIAELEAGTFIAICEIVTDARGGVAFPGAFNIYDTWIDVTFGDGSTATWRAAAATAAGTPTPANPELANDAYVSTFTTLSLLSSEVHGSGGVVVLSGYIGPISYSSGTEPRYTCNGQFDLSMPAGQILGNILSSCGGRLTTTAGRFRCNPAAYPGTSLVLAATSGGFPGWGLAGWGLRAFQTASGRYLWSYDALGTYIGPFGADITWDVFCPAINQAVLIALETNGDAAFVQSASDASATVAFTSANALGNCIVADITFTAGSYTAGPVTVTDSNGNTYVFAAGGPAPFQGTFLMSFVASNCAAGANTVTVAIGGSFPFVEISVDITEYQNVTGVVNASAYSDGGMFGTGNTVNVSVTPDAFCVLHLAVASGCLSIGVAGGADAAVGPMQILANSFRWKPRASVHDLFNAVKGTYISPFTNWQVSDFPPYMQDTLHGYFSGSPLSRSVTPISRKTEVNGDTSIFSCR